MSCDSQNAANPEDKGTVEDTTALRVVIGGEAASLYLS